jgi:signal transduction histidine kinase
VTTGRLAQGARVQAKRWFPAGFGDATVILAVAVEGVMLTVVTGLAVHHHGVWLLIPLLACLPIVVLRRWPLPVLGVATVAAGMVAALGIASLPFSILLGLTLYFSALRLSRPKSIALTLAVATVIGTTVAYSGLAVATAQPAVEVVENFVPLAGAWFIADSVAARRRYLAGLAAQAQRERAAGIRAERMRIAREMHDVIAHTLAVMTVQAGVGRRLADKHPQHAASALQSIETIGRMAQDELRVVLGLLRDGEAETAPLAPAPRLIDLKNLADTVRASGIPVELRMEGVNRQLSPSLELSVYRVAQEALTNVVKHAPGATAVAELTVSAGKVRMVVCDDGGPAGGDAPRAGMRAGHGIVGMQERISAFGGRLVAGPTADGGFQVTAEVPIDGGAS